MGAAKKVLEVASLKLNASKYLVKKWQAAAVNLQVYKSSAKLDDMTEELDDMMEEVADSTEENKKASASLTAAKKTLNDAKMTIEKGRKTLAKQSTSVLETALQLAAAKALAAAARTSENAALAKKKVGNDKAITKTKGKPGNTKAGKSPGAMKSELAALNARLAKLEGFLKGAYADVSKTQKEINKASTVATKTPAVINERTKQQAATDTALKKALSEKDAQAQKIAAQQKTIDELRAKYLQMLPKKKTVTPEKPATPAAPVKK